MFQFTHPGGVRRNTSLLLKYLVQVSIHAPGRGATRRYSIAGFVPLCFNSRTREGCDISLANPAFNLVEFQFTHPGGVRHQ